MNKMLSTQMRVSNNMVTFFHDIEQDFDSTASPEDCRRIVREFISLEKAYNVPATYNVVGRLFQEQPDLIEWILQAGQEVAFHSYNHQPDWRSEYYANEVALCRQVSVEPQGYRSPQSEWDQTTLKALWENGFRWNAEYDPHPEPYFIHHGLVRLPVAEDDWPLETGAMGADEWSRSFLRSLKKRSYFAFGSHDRVASFAPKERLAAWEKVLQLAVDRHVLLVTFSEAADLFRRAVLARYSDTLAFDSTWPQGFPGKRIYDLIKTETTKLDEPVVAGLGAKGALLACGIQDTVGRVYCVDRNAHRLQMIRSGRCVGIASDVTSSGLADDSVDMVINAHTIEHLFWPDLFADEIKRISKIGATFVVIFAAGPETEPDGGHEFVERIRHYFTPAEIQAWASQIGPGTLMDVEGESGELAYRVYVGTVRNQSRSPRYPPAIPLSAFRFRFPNRRYGRIKVHMARTSG